MVLRTARRAEPEDCPLEDCAGLVCAGDIPAGRDYPFFSFSSMDGYAVRVADLEHASSEAPVSLPLAGEKRAAAGAPPELPPGATLRVMTGAAVPGGAEAVVMREQTREGESEITFFGPAVMGANINRAGEEIAAGVHLLDAGTVLTPPALGLLATLGHRTVSVYPPPKVGLLTTGDELVAPGGDLLPGQIYDSIAPMLSAALRAAGVFRIEARRCPDDPAALQAAFSGLLERSDMVLTVGGVSMGDYDHLVQVFESAGVEKIFWKVAQKPGKPLWFGRAGRKLVFGLPGNPASALVCFSLYALSAVRSFIGLRECGPRWLEGTLAQAVENREARVNFMRGDYAPDSAGGYAVQPARGQVSYMLGSFAASRALLEIPSGPLRLERGARVRFLPHFWGERL